MDQAEQDSITEGTQPRWQIWAMLAVAIGCVATLASTLYDIA